jgi:hypothetical protein
MTEKLLPCPFCGSTDLEILPEDPSRYGNDWGAVQCVSLDCPTYDGFRSHGVRVGDGQDVSDERGSDAYKSQAIAAWNRRTPAPEGEACGGCGETDPTKRCIGCLHNFHSQPLYAPPVVPVGVSEDDLLHKTILRLKDHIKAVQVGKAASKGGERTETNPILDCINALPEIVRHLDAAEFEIESAFERYENASPVVPVSREELARMILDFPFNINRREDVLELADAILAALGTTSTDTGREG